jgi:hypothetical protein
VGNIMRIKAVSPEVHPQSVLFALPEILVATLVLLSCPPLCNALFGSVLIGDLDHLDNALIPLDSSLHFISVILLLCGGSFFFLEVSQHTKKERVA